ncbi:MAG: hypothetical protein ABSC01_11540 [Verrucomicrobiota bacterium]
MKHIAVIMAEAFAQSASSRDLETLPIGAFKTTLSYAMARAIAIGVLTKQVSPLFDRWTELVGLTNQSKQRMSVMPLGNIWSTLERLNPSEKLRENNLPSHLSAIAEACNQLLVHGEITDSVWDDLTEGDQSLRMLREEMKKTGNIE